MEDLGEMKHILGISVSRNRNDYSLSINQKAYLKSVLNKFGMSNCKPTQTPMVVDFQKQNFPDSPPLQDSKQYSSLIGSLMYAALGTRPDIYYAVVTLSRHNISPTEATWNAAKRILRYIQGTLDFCITYKSNGKYINLTSFCDADWGNEIIDRRSISGYCFLLGDGAISWQSKKQNVVSLSSTEAEYRAVTPAIKEVTWIYRTLKDLHSSISTPIELQEDNQGCIELSKNAESHQRTKHIDIQYHFIRDNVNNKFIKLIYCPTESMTADILTKPLPREQFFKLRKMLGLS